MEARNVSGLSSLLDVGFFLVLASFGAANAFFLNDVPPLDAVLSFLICTTSAWVMCLDSLRRVNLLRVFAVFSYFFFGIIPAIELSNDVRYWGGAPFGAEIYATGSFFVLILNVLLFAAYKLNWRVIRLKSEPQWWGESSDRELGGFRVLTAVLISLVCFFVVFSANNYNLIGLVLRGGDLVSRVERDSLAVFLVREKFLRFLPFALFLMALYFVKRHYLLKLFLGFLAILLAFPTAIPRLAVPALYVPLVLYFFPTLVRGSRLVGVLIFGLLFVFPFLDQFRNFRAGDPVVFFVDSRFLVSGHFDAFQNFVRLIESGWVSGGEQLLGVVFFFFPRSLWADKPVGTGAELASRLGFDFGNVSATWYAEGWANYGFFGAAMFAVVLGALMALLDKKIWVQRCDGFWRVFYPVMLGYLFFLLRGDLLSAFAYLIGLFVAFAFAYALLVGWRRND